MTKVLWLINPYQFSEKDADFPYYIQKLTQCNLSGVFLEDHVFDALPMFSGDPMFPTVDYSIMSNAITDEATRMREEKKAFFLDTCVSKGLKISLQDDMGDPVKEMMLESRFADMILVKSSLSFKLLDKDIPSNFVKKVLSKAECPVLIMPDDHQQIDELYFTYNGGYSSVYAIRQFTYLFPKLKDLPVTVLTVDEGKHDSIKHEKEIKELLSVHYPDFTFKVLKGDVETELLVEMLTKKNIVATYGAFGRSNLSRLFRRGSSDKVIEVIDIPIFITHP